MDIDHDQVAGSALDAHLEAGQPHADGCLEPRSDSGMPIWNPIRWRDAHLEPDPMA